MARHAKGTFLPINPFTALMISYDVLYDVFRASYLLVRRHSAGDLLDFSFFVHPQENQS